MFTSNTFIMNSNPLRTIFYTIERAIKEYRKYAQKNISKQIDDITLDQALVLMILKENSSLSQKEMSEFLFKDYASMTRMIELMVKKKYLKRSQNKKDKRRSILTITKKGEDAIKILIPTIKINRINALEGITDLEIKQLNKILKKIISNCNKD